ncbi:MAG: DUF2891 domain-containing protein [Burkholderiales bacterium]|nr:DUF2891 domain-containing protein [Burkholderiales bacterium]
MIQEELATSIATIGLAGAVCEYPNKLDHVLHGADDLRSPRALHPAFYGCYDWHSAVHTHWMLARLLRVVPDLPAAARIEALFDAHLSDANLAAELAYASAPGRAGFERPYGWAWTFALTAELGALARAGRSASWHAALQPLAGLFRERLIEHLARQTYPIRAGTHANTAFALSLTWDYARAEGDAALAEAVRAAALRFYDTDRDGPANFEPSGNDFLSPCLVEAELMTRCYDAIGYARWSQRFLPGFLGGIAARLLVPATVSDRADAQGVHLDGLNLSRAWCLAGMADHLPEGEPRRAALRKAAREHLAAGLAHVQSGDYLGEHWLGTFAVKAMTQGGWPS